MRTIVLVVLVLCSVCVRGQGVNNNWLIGYNNLTDTYTTAPKAIIDFSSGAPFINPGNRKMPFDDAQSNISDANGNLLMYTNGVWIANATGDTMLNGSGLNPNSFTSDWPDGLPYPQSNIFLPFPGDSNKYILFHTTGNYNDTYSRVTDLYYSIIDITQDGGLGKVVLKNQIIIHDTLEAGITACRHANGRDWWVIAIEDSSDIVYKVLVTPTGISVSTQSLGLPIINYGGVPQPVFSPNGQRFACLDWNYTTAYHMNVRVFNFDRCSGLFSHQIYIPIDDNHPAFGLEFSPNSNYLYASSGLHIFQITPEQLFTVDTVATFDGYYSPVPPFNTSFWELFLAPDGKIYGTTGNSTIDLHVINNPDSTGIACDVQQHSLHLPCWSFRTTPNFPNYFLGPLVGSPCDTITTSTKTLPTFNFQLSTYPNPATSNSQITFTYSALTYPAEIIINNIDGKEMGRYRLPQWSTTQKIKLPELAAGVYVARMVGEGVVGNVKFVVE